MKKLSQKDKQAWKKKRKSSKEERRTQKEKIEEQRQQSWEKEKVDLEKMGRAREMKKRSQKEEQAQEEKPLVWEEKRQTWKEKNWAWEEEETLVQKVEEEVEKIKQQPREKMKLVLAEEKMMKDIEKMFQEKEEQVMEKEKQAKRKEEQTSKEEETAEKEKKWTQRKVKLVLQEEKLIQEEIHRQKEREVEPKKQQALEMRKLSQKEEDVKAGEMEKQFQEKEEKFKKKEKRALEKLTEEDSKERNIAKKEKAKAKEGIEIIKRKKKINQEERETMKEENKLSWEERTLSHDSRIKEMHTAEGKTTKEKRIQAIRKPDREKGISSEEKKVSPRGKNTEMKENQLLKVFAGIIKEMCPVSLEEEMEITEEERSSIMRSEVEGHGPSEEITKEEREQAQKGRKLKDDRPSTKERTLTDEESLEEDQRLLEEVQDKILFDKIQVKTVLKNVQEQNLLEKKQLEELLEKIEENESEKTQVKWLLETIREKLFEGLSESETEEETKESLIKKGKEEESLLEEEEKILPKKKKERYLIKEKKKGKVSPSEEKLEEDLAKNHKKKSLATQKKMRLTKEKEMLSKKEKEGPSEEESLTAEWEYLSEEKQKEESLSEENLSEKEEKSLSEEEEERISEEKEESLSEEEEEKGESLSEGEEESLSEEEEEKEEKKEESLSEKKVSLSEDEEESLSEEEEEEENLCEEEECLSEDRKHYRLPGVMFPEHKRALKSQLSKEVGLSKPVIESEGIAQEREGITRRKRIFKKEHLLDGQTDSKLTDKSPFKIPLQTALGEKEGMAWKVTEDLSDLKKKQGSQLLGETLMTSLLGRQENIFLEKAKGMFLQAMATGLQTQISEGPQRPGFQFSDIIIKPQKSKPKGNRWKWLWDGYSLLGKTKDQAPAPDSSFERLADSEVSVSDEDWINNTLIKLEAGGQLSRDSFHRLSQLLRDFTPDRSLIHLSTLKAITKHLSENLDLSHTNISRPCKDVLSPLCLKVIPPTRRKEKQSWPEPFSIPESKFSSATKTQNPQAPSWSLLAESYRKKQVHQLPTAVREIKHFYPTRRDVVPKGKNFLALKGNVEFPQFFKAKKKTLPTPVPMLPPITQRIQVSKTINWHLLDEPYRSARIQQLHNAVKEMETRHFYPAKRDLFTGAHASVDKQTLALMFQKDLRAFKGKDKFPKLPKLEKKTQPISQKKEKTPPWEIFVALYHVLRMLQQRYAKDTAAWMEQFHQLMDLYQLKSPRIQRLLQDLLLREEPQPKQIIYKEALNATELVPGERVFYCLVCGHSHVPSGSLKFQNVIPISGQNKVHTVQPVGIAQYGFLELAWKRLPTVNPSHIERLPNTSTL